MTNIWDALIVGSGFSGLAMADRLQRSGGWRFLILERDEAVGGTWRDNRYPGCACDVPSHLYSLSFAAAHDWPRRYAGHADIQAYLEAVARRFRPHLRCNAAVTQSVFDEAQALWHVTLADGSVLRTRFLIAGLGPLNRPALPDFPGLEQFAGRVFHSMHWPQDLSCQGKRVAVVGTGASAIQIVPALASRVEQLTVFQRSAPWVVAKGDRPYSRFARACLRRIPGLRTLYRAWLYASQEIVGLAFLHPALMRLASRRVSQGLGRRITDPALRQQLTPHHPMGCKRILLSDDYYPALQRPNVTLVTDPIVRITPGGVVSADGGEHAADVLVFATGFRHAEVPSEPVIRGLGGKTLQHVWRERRVAYLGSAVAGFPNFFLLGGPNSGLGHNSVVFMIEAQAHWILQALRAARRRQARTIALRPGSYEKAGREMARRSHTTVWEAGCRSWYLDEQGHNTAIWPGLSVEFWLRTRRFNARDFILENHDCPAPAHPGSECSGATPEPARHQRGNPAAELPESH
ncbi:MAG: NAD(P)/FAD-dependent oxidoreductase [Betaproteobacteria bacterium]|nr:NAD(P)/FAD-dependent oxidoreductase [Betaproteobacteria bacterium]MDE2211760.1 NAD(P)/FAD-dependent oxidoreductase [Betaproteobacteria bacterium]